MSRRSVTIAALLVSLLTCGSALAQPASPKPRIPPERDPGGIAVAMVGGGVDYTRPGIAARLARDGEGEIIGWDFVDRDNRPFDRCVAMTPDAGPCPTALAEVVLGSAPTSRLVVARVDGARLQTIADAIRMIARTPARIVLIATDPPVDPALLRDASRLNTGILFIAIGTAPGPKELNSSEWPENLVLEGTATVGAATAARASNLKSALPALDAAGLRAKLDAERLQR